LENGIVFLLPAAREQTILSLPVGLHAIDERFNSTSKGKKLAHLTQTIA